MAIDCGGIQVASKLPGSNSRDEEFSCAKFESPIICAASAPNLGKDNSFLGTHHSSTAVASEVSANGRRYITDLPPALVSEILHHLDAKELGIAACVCSLFKRLVSEHYRWKEFYCERWGLPPAGSRHSGLQETQSSWKDLYIEREGRSRALLGRYNVDVLYGHTEAVRSVFVLTSAKLVFSGGYDSVIRIWNMEEGMLIASSQPLGCTIRAVAADEELLVAAGTDAFLQCWRAVEGVPHLFDISGPANRASEFRLWGHEGPVSCVALDSNRIYSGSWDMSIRIWDRARMKCIKVLRHSDWVWDLSPRGSSLASSAGRDVYIWDLDSWDLVRTVGNAHVGNTHALARNHTGDLLFTGGEDGAIQMFEIIPATGACSYSPAVDDCVKPVACWVPHKGPVYALAFEFPWVVSCSSDGKLALIDVRKLLRSRRNSSRRCYSTAPGTYEAPHRMLHGFGCNLFSVAIGADRIVSAGEEGVVRIWDFSQALEIERRVQALRGMRLENRARRRKAQLALGGGKGSRSDQCSVVAKRNQMNGDRSNAWSRRGASSKLKA
ncbi:unnamed protein product [Victoria cruziana]